MTQFYDNAFPEFNQSHNSGQDWSAYNAAQVNEQRIFTQLLRELCDLIEQPPQSNGRPCLPLSDMTFTLVMKVYRLVSSRRFMGDVHSAYDNEDIDISPCFNTISAYLRKPAMEAVLKKLIEVSSLPLKAVETDFAVDSSGFATNGYDRWFDHKWGKDRRYNRWVKAHIICGVKTNIITSAETTMQNTSDQAYFGQLVHDTHQRFDMQEVSADKAYLTGRNLEIAHDVGAIAYIPFKTNSRAVAKRGSALQKILWQQAYYLYHYQRDIFNAHYHKRSNVESTFWMVKSKFGPSVRSKTAIGQTNEVLAKLLCHNIVVMVHSMFELGVVPEFQKQGLIEVGPLPFADAA